MESIDAIGPNLNEVIVAVVALGVFGVVLVFGYLFRRRRISRQQDASNLSKDRGLSRYREQRLQSLSSQLPEDLLELQVEVIQEDLQKRVFSGLVAMTEACSEHVLLTGGGGSGKTTLLTCFEKSLHEREELIPIYIELCTYPKQEQPELRDWLEQQWCILAPKGAPTLDELLQEAESISIVGWIE